MKLSELRNYIIEGNEEGAEKWTREALSRGTDPLVILDEGLVPGMDVVGEKFKAQEYFIPHVLFAAKAMKTSMALLRPMMTEREGVGTQRVVIGTVKGDLHDIGKSMVGMALEGAGFEVIDLGADVAPETFVKAVEDQQASMLCMSALLTTTRTMMHATIECLKDAELRQQVKVMVGGAPVTESYASEIGAEGYAPDAFTAVDRAKELLGIATK